MANRDLRRTGLRLEYASIGWNAFEGLAAIAAGFVAHSVALTAFGLDSSVEVAASSVAAWQLKAKGTGRDRMALRAIGICFLVVAVYVGVEAAYKLIEGKHPLPSPVGIVLTAAAALVMTGLGVSKHRVGTKLRNPVLVAEARFSLVDAALSATVLAGLTLNAVAGLWWADPVVAILLALFATREGVEGIRR